MEKMITSNKKGLSISRLTKRLWVCCGLVMLLLGSGTSWAQTCYTLNFGGGNYINETSWELSNSNDEIVAEGDGEAVADMELCLTDDCYTLTMSDIYGDSWDGNDWTLSLGQDIVAGPFALEYGPYTSSVDFALGNVECEVPPAPINDECAGALPIGGFVDGVASIIGNNTNATNSGIEADCFYSGVQNDVWFSFVAPENGNLTIETSLIDDNFDDTQIQVFDACGGASVACDDDDGPSLLSLITLACGDYIPGATYFIQVDGYGGDMGDFGLSVTTDEIDCSNLCTSPELTLTAVANPNNEPLEDCLETDGEFYVMAALSGGTGNSGYSIAANGGIDSPVVAEGSFTFGPFPAGTNVNVVATGLEDATCGAEGSIDSPAICPPDNDSCLDALPLVCGADSVVVNSAGSTAVGPDGCGTGNSGLWYSFTGTGGDITISSYADFDHELTIKSGSCDELIQVGCRDLALSNQEESYTIVGSVVGAAYYVYVAHYNPGSTVTGTVTMKITCAEPPACEAPQLNLIVTDLAGNPIDCLEQDGEFYVLAILSGGSGNDSFDVTANGGDVQNILNQTSYPFGPFPVGTDVEVIATGADDADCGAEGTADSPEVCAPINDNCANAAPIECGETISGTTYGATLSGIPAPCGGGTLADAFYTMEALPEYEYVITVNGDDYDGVLSIYSGSCDDELTVIDCVDDGYSAGFAETITFTVEEATTVLIRTWDWSSTRGNFSLSLECIAPPVCEAPLLDLLVVNVAGDPIEGCLPADGLFYVNATLSGGSGNDSYNVSANGGEPVNVLADGSTLLGPFNAGPGVDVVAVGADDAVCDAEGSVDSPEVCPLPAPSNDMCAGAIALECGVTVTGNTVNANPEEDASCNAFGSQGNGVWYTITLDVSSLITLQTCLNGTDFDTDLSVFTGSCDDLVCFEGFSGDGYVDGLSSCGFRADGSFIAAANQTYYILLDGYGVTDMGDYELAVSCEDLPEPPENDDCADAIPFEVGEAGIVGDNTNATPDGPEMDCAWGGDLVQKDVWFSFVAPENGNLTIETSSVDGSSFSDTQMQILDGCDGNILSCSEDVNGLFAEISLDCGEYVPGQTYLVQVDGWNGGSGAFKLSVVADDAICYDCPEFEANIGEECDDNDPNTENDVYVDGCGCAGTPIVPSTCDNFVYFLSDHKAADGISDIYQVTLSGGNANLEFIAQSEIEVHIAYNQIDNLIYAVSKHTNSYRVLDPYAAVPAFGPTVDLGADYGELTAAAFNADGKLLIGSQNNNAIYSVNVATNVVSPYDTYAPVTGGDIAFGSDGMLYLATRTGNGLYEVWTPPTADQFIGSAPNNVTGLAITDADQLIMSSKGSTNLALSNSNGSAAGLYAVMLNGEAYTLNDGDMASGCDSHTPVGDDCDYRLYYIHSPAAGGNNPLLEVTLNNDGTASYNAIIANMPGHLGLSPDGATIYVVNNSSLKVIDVATASVIHSVTIKNVAGQTISSIPAVVVGSDGTLYVGSSSKNQVYTVDPISGTAIPYGPSRTVQGGDLIEADGEIWLITRNNNKFTNVMTGANFTVPVNEINGAAVLDNGNVLLADGNGGSLMKEVDLSTQMVVGTYDIGLPLHNGDLAGNCTMPNPVEEGCYGAEIIDFSQGPQTNGGAVPAGRSDANKALGEPDKSNAAGGFVSLGVGGSITIGFGGVVNDEAGADIKIYETSFSGDVCGSSDDERADIELSADGVNFVSVGTICRDGEVDMADAGLDHVVAIRITNAASTSSLDGYDVDGVEAINGCGNEPVIIPGECYAAEVVEYIQGEKSNGGAIDINRTDANEALGMPERTDELVFVTLGYGGSITLAFNGAVPNGEGADIEVVETTWGHVTCNTEPEFANVSVSVDGENWAFAKTICRADGFVDISDAGDFDYINFVKIENNDALTSTHDGFDVDGVVALYNCEVARPAAPELEAQSVITSYPNPTAGQSEVVFTAAKTGTTLVEVYDMNGRNVATIFNEVANANQEYRLDFDGNYLPNGVYIYRLTTNNETIINKFMIAR